MARGAILFARSKSSNFAQEFHIRTILVSSTTLIERDLPIPLYPKTTTKNKKMNTTKLIALAVLSSVLLACSREQSTQEVARSVYTYEVGAGVDAPTTVFPGKVKAAGEANLAFRIAGQITQIYAKPGKLIRRGEVLATLDSRDYTTQLAATEAEYQSIKAQADRIVRLYEQQSVSANDYDKAVGALSQITQKLKAHRNTLADTRLVAPYDGYIREPLRHAGETVGAGMPVLTIYSSGTPEVEINISATDYLQRERFVAFSCTVDALPGRTFPLELVSISPVANVGQLYTVRLRFTEVADTPALGMSTMVSIQLTDEADTGLLVPMDAIWERAGQSYVWVVEGDSTSVQATPVAVREIKRSGMAVCTGLQTGMQIVSAGVASLSDGQRVRPIAPASPTNVGGLL